MPVLIDVDHGAVGAGLDADCSQCMSDYTYKMPYNAQNQALSLAKIKKGDLVGYAHHLSMVHSDKPTCTAGNNGQAACSYEIIHAYGGDRADLDNDPTTPMVFTRKVVITPNNMQTSNGAFPAPTGFGRIKLWD